MQNRIAHIHDRLFEPIFVPDSPETAQKARLTAQLTLTVLVLLSGIGVLLFLRFGEIDIYMIALLAVSGGAYGASRTRFYQIAGVLMVLILCANTSVIAMDSLNVGDINRVMVVSWFGSMAILCYLLFTRYILYGTLAFLLSCVIFVSLSTSAILVSLYTSSITIVLLVIVADYLRNGRQREIDIQREALETERNRYQVIAKMFTDHAYVVRRKPDGTYTIDWHSQSETLFGYTLEEFDARRYEFIHPDDVDAVRNLSQRLSPDESHEIIFRLTAKSGEIIHVLNRVSTFDDGAGGMMVYGTFRDITAQHKEQEAHRATEARYMRLFENATFGVFRITPEGKLLEANPALAQILGYSSAEQLKTELTNFHTLYVEEDVRWQFEEMIQRDMVVHDFEYRAYRRDDTIIWLSKQVRAICDDDNTIVAYEGMVNDITTRKYVAYHRQEMEKAQERVKVLERFVGSVTHDFLTPITTMKTSLYLLGKTVADEKALQRVETLNAQTNHLQLSINSLMQLIKTSELELNKTETHLNHLIETIISEQQLTFDQRQQQVHFNADAIYILELDEIEFKYVIRQLLLNASAHSDKGQHIFVKLSSGDDNIVIKVIDQGTGILPEDQPHIFEPFFRASERATDKGGVGVGLTIAKFIVEAHDGTISAYSEVGQGATFAIHLPR